MRVRRGLITEPASAETCRSPVVALLGVGAGRAPSARRAYGVVRKPLTNAAPGLARLAAHDASAAVDYRHLIDWIIALIPVAAVDHRASFAAIICPSTADEAALRCRFIAGHAPPLACAARASPLRPQTAALQLLSSAV